MRLKPIYILTENLNFFYKINNGLKEKRVQFRILTFWDKIPNIPSVILTTAKESSQIEIVNKDTNLLEFIDGDDINQYILKVLAVFRLGYQDYDNLLFSIDPGLNHIGIVVFLDDYFFDSSTLTDKSKVINYIKKYVDSIQQDNTNPLSLDIKFGKGLLETTQDLVNCAFSTFSNILEMKVFLIDESNTSKIKISNQGKKFPKHESAALILSFREGLDVKYQNYKTILKTYKTNSLIKERLSRYSEGLTKDYIIKFSKIAEAVIMGEKTLSES
ncbi:MAG: hypothetical protein MUP85_18675, partial [Candidatus Lokiarchaeota archaeon]|nr:hypothetical protein [Candidatus Lokiarchaeota archaeon]